MFFMSRDRETLIKSYALIIENNLYCDCEISSFETTTFLLIDSNESCLEKVSFSELKDPERSRIHYNYHT